MGPPGSMMMTPSTPGGPGAYPTQSMGYMDPNSPMTMQGSMPPMSGMQSMGAPTTMQPMGGQQPVGMSGQYAPNVSRPQMTSVANPPIVAGNMQYGPSYKMQYQKRSTADKTAVKYTGFLPLEGVYEEDTCRIG